MTASATSDLASVLRARGRRVTSQRLAIHETLRALARHVTAEEVHAAVLERLPSVSLPTVYATLELLEELGAVRRISAGEGAVLYDPRPDQHHHLVCRRCGRVDDVEAPLDLAAAVGAASERGYEVDRVEVVVTGLCAACTAAREA